MCEKLKRLFVAILGLLLLGAADAVAQSRYYWDLGWSSIYGHRLPYVGHYAYDYFVKGEQEGEMGCARVVVAGLTLLDKNPGRNKPEIIRLIGKWYKQDEKIALMAAGFYLPKNTIDPGEIILSWHNGEPEKYAYVPGQQPNLKQSLYYAKYAYEKLNSQDGDADRFYKLLLAYCYKNGVAGYAKDERKAARYAAEEGQYDMLAALVAKENSLGGLASLMKDCLPDLVWNFTMDEPVSGTGFKARRALLADRFMDLGKAEKASQWASFPSDVKEFLNAEAASVCSLETDFSSMTVLVDAWPDPALKNTVMGNLSSDYKKKYGKVISTTRNSGEAVYAFGSYEKALAGSGLLSGTQLSTDHAAASKAFAQDLNERCSRAFSSFDKEKTGELFSYADALVKEGYITQSQALPVRTAVEKYLQKQITSLHVGSSLAENRAKTLLSEVKAIQSIQPKWLAGNSVVAEAESAARETLDLVSARAEGNSAGYHRFLSAYPNGYEPYRKEAEQKYAELLAEEQDAAAFNAAYALTKTPSASQKKSILAMPMSSSMRNTVGSMLTSRYIRQHNKGRYTEEYFRDATLRHTSAIDWTTSGPFSILAGGIIGGIKGPDWKYGANGFYAGLAYNFYIGRGIGVETGACYIFEKGKYVDQEFYITEKNGLFRQAVGVPLHLTFGAGRHDGKVNSTSVGFVFFTGPAFRYNFLAKGYYAGEYHENLHADTEWFTPFDVRYDLGMLMSVSHVQVSVGGDLGLRHTNFTNGNKILDYRIYLGAAVIF